MDTSVLLITFFVFKNVIANEINYNAAPLPRYLLKNVNADEVNTDMLQTCSLKNESAVEENTNSTLQRNGKQLLVPFFRVGLVRFVNGVCTAYGSLMGTCYTRRDCTRATGTPSSRCANTIGVCCVIYRSCGQSSNINNTYFISQGFPTTFTGNSDACTYTIQKIDDNICQVRIDFLTLTLAQPNATGVCTTDALTISGGASIPPVLCGDNTGQHMYVDFNGNSSIIISIATSGTSVNRAWNIRVSQINCNCPYRAPSGCLQFFNSTTGTVRSFNYGPPPQSNTRQLVNQNYGVCVAMIAGYCGIQWSQTNIGSFTVTGDTFTAIQNGMIGMFPAEQVGAACTTDFVVIPSPTFTNAANGALNADRFCGNGFDPVTSNNKPFVLTVVTDGDELNDLGNAGFSLDFAQTRCSAVNN